MTDASQPLSSTQVEAFRDDGILVLRSFFDLQEDIEPIQRGIYDIIGLISKRHGFELSRPDFSPDTFDAGFEALCAANRTWAGEVYDAIKLIPDFVRLSTSKRLEAIFAQLRETDRVGSAAGGCGIRIDIPGEERFSAPWHQEYPAQFRSIDGITFWSPLMPMTKELGPVQTCRGSHKEGLLRVFFEDSEKKSGAYALRIERESEILAEYPEISPLSEPGDVILIDFLLVHASGANRSNRSRWSIQSRFFNFEEPVGMQIGWLGSFAAGNNISDVHPELIVDSAPVRKNE